MLRTSMPPRAAREVVQVSADLPDHADDEVLEPVRTPDDYVIKREAYWKDVLLSREFGNNRN
jgi:hypothetical protein